MMEAASVLTSAVSCEAVDAQPIPLASALKRRTRQGAVSWGDHRVTVGGDAPVRVQSMTNTDTADAVGTAIQVKELALAGSEMVRITVNNDESAKAVPYIREQLDRMGVMVPLIGDFHYNGHRLLTDHPACAEAGVNWGSLDQDLLARLMDQNAQRAEPWDARHVMYEALITSALVSARRAEEIGLNGNHIVLSCKVSGVQDLIAVYQELAKRCDYPLHLGLTEAGMGTKGTVASAAALAVLLQQGIGDTIRVSLTPQPGESRTQEVVIASEILQALGIRAFVPSVIACPGCGRTTSTTFQELAKQIDDYLRSSMPLWRERYPGVENLKVAVMGCIVNGPGESKHADLGISLPGTGEAPAAPVFIDGQKAMTLRGEGIAQEFQQIVENYIEKRFGAAA